MTRQIREVMNPDPTTLSADASVADAARCMRDHDVGDVLVELDGQLRGIVTERDIVVHSVAEDRDLSQVRLGEVCTGEIITLDPETSVEEAVRLMRERALRRLPVCQDGRVVGVVAIGDLIIEFDLDSALAASEQSSGNRDAQTLPTEIRQWGGPGLVRPGRARYA